MLSITPFFITAALAVGTAGGSAAPAPTQLAVTPEPTTAFVRADAEKAVSDLAAALEENFVFPDKGQAYAAMLRKKLSDGAYAHFDDAASFAAKVTADLQAVHKDGHLRLRVASPPPTADADATRQAGPPKGSAVGKSGWLAPGVAYVDLRGFPGNAPTIGAVRDILAAHRDAKTLILDVRHNGGGGLDEMNLIFAEIFAKPVTLVTMDIRQAVEEKHGTPFADNDPVLPKIAGPGTIIRRQHLVVPAKNQGALKNAKIILLTSKKTFSAAEHFSLALKRTKRATLIGEATGGGAHFGGTIPMGVGYAAFIPVGRTFDPDTGQSWEGTGVPPDVAVPSDQALDTALKLAGVNSKGDVALAALR